MYNLVSCIEMINQGLIMNSNISLSFELVLLLNWLLKHKKAQLNDLIKDALENGFMQEIAIVSPSDHSQLTNQFYNSILEFLLFFEQSLLKNLAAINADEATNSVILPLVKKIDFDNLDAKTLWLSMQQTKKKISTNKADHNYQPEKINDLLFEQLLKNWKPNKKNPLN